MLSRGARAAVQSSRHFPSRPTSRFASHSAHHAESAHHVAAGSGSESLGVCSNNPPTCYLTAIPSHPQILNLTLSQKGFYITLSLISVGLVSYTVATSSDTAPRITRLIGSFKEQREERDGQRNALHQAAAEQAAYDRQLFASATPSHTGVDLRYPE